MSGDVIKRYVLPDGIAETPQIRGLVRAQHAAVAAIKDSSSPRAAAINEGVAYGLLVAMSTLIGPSR